MKKSDPHVAATFGRLPAMLDRDVALIQRGRLVDVDCLLGSTEQAFHVAIRAGRIIDMVPAPVLMRSWTFGYRATPDAWTAFWQPMPKAGWHDLLALTKRSAATLEGDVRPFMTHLQYFKDLLALPRATGGVA
ncbi:hypothetical protein JQ554_23770 [Bradyrhizobium diazoefficiens]|nr:hypothetical protein [Bradyrhizobium diazoefficiens]UCF52322.1 MAG: hypothetical protein JSV48_24260 [Bradyrhizobium sp.]MBR0979197.1 hypothetical protein [Bradyrhizobium diazoefficiens]MBR1010056.1 hypothetical protein [Bradyrhizobium diazoefficiens]MBR1016634.1 hypothetical protein [Bradyrhizobium diazoefficiens]